MSSQAIQELTVQLTTLMELLKAQNGQSKVVPEVKPIKTLKKGQYYLEIYSNTFCKAYNDETLKDLVYEGEYDENYLRHGQGKLYNKGKLEYEGEFSKGYFHGNGIQYYPNKKVIMKVGSNNIIEYNNGDIFKGITKDHEPYIGTLKRTDGTELEYNDGILYFNSYKLIKSEIQKDFVSAEIKDYKCDDGSVYHGEINIKENKIQFINGKLIKTNGDYYEGLFQDNKPTTGNHYKLDNVKKVIPINGRFYLEISKNYGKIFNDKELTKLCYV